MSDDSSDEETGIFSYGNKKTLTFNHNNVVLSEESSEESDDVENGEEDSTDEEIKLIGEKKNDDDDEVLSPSAKKMKKDTSMLLSPSPPPRPKFQAIQLKRKKNAGDSVLEKLKCGVVITPSTPSSMNDSCVIEVEDAFKVKVRLHGKVKKFEVQEDKPLLELYERIASEEKIPLNQVVLELKGNTIETNQTILSLKITIVDIIDSLTPITGKSETGLYRDDGLIVQRNENGHELDKIQKEVIKIFQDIECFIYENNSIAKLLIKIQGNGKNTKHEYHVMPTEKLERILKEYCTVNNTTLQKTVFSFDGDVISPSQSANDLDIESDDVIDAKLT